MNDMPKLIQAYGIPADMSYSENPFWGFID
jgi:hypothetical protein